MCAHTLKVDVCMCAYSGVGVMLCTQVEVMGKG